MSQMMFDDDDDDNDDDEIMPALSSDLGSNEQPTICSFLSNAAQCNHCRHSSFSAT